jgi:hypothetical protein
MLRKFLAVLATVTSVVIIGSASPASAACPPAGCLVDVGMTTTYADANTRIQVWMRIDYTNHRIRPYARFDTYSGVTLQGLATDPYGNTPRATLTRGGSQVQVDGTPYSGSTTSLTVYGSLYTCPASPGDYKSWWSGMVDTSSYDYAVNLPSGLAQTTCGW